MLSRTQKTLCLLRQFRRCTSVRSIHLKRSWLETKIVPNSLAARFNEYILNEDNRPNTQSSKNNLNPVQLAQISQLSFEELCDHINLHIAIRTDDPSSTVSALDSESLLRIPRLSHRQLLDLIHAFHRLLPHNFTHLDCFAPAMARICETYESDQSTGDFVRICYYLGASKKTGQFPGLLDQFVRRHFNKYLHRVTSMDLAIVAAATYRTAVPLQLKQAKRFEQEILGLKNTKDLDWPLLNVFIKTLRLSRLPAGRVQHRLIEWMKSGRLDEIEFRGLAHLFVYFADNRVRDPSTMEWFCRQTMRKVDAAPLDKLRGSKEFKSDWRAKDFRLIIWCLAHLNLGGEFISVGEIEVLGGIVMSHFRAGEYAKEKDDLVDLTMSLWQLGFGNAELFRTLFQNYSPEPPPVHRDRVKLDGRKNLLLFCIELEHPEWLDELNVPRTRTHVFQEDRAMGKKFAKHSVELYRVKEALERVIGGDSVQLVCPVRNLNIPGILVCLKGQRVRFIEVLERHMILSNGQTPFGVMQLKLDILRRLGYSVDLVIGTLLLEIKNRIKTEFHLFQLNVLDQSDQELNLRIHKLLNRPQIPNTLGNHFSLGKFSTIFRLISHLFPFTIYTEPQTRDPLPDAPFR